MVFKKWLGTNSLRRQFVFLYSFTTVICIIILALSIYATTKSTMEQIGMDNTKQNTISSLSHISAFIDDIEYNALLIQNNEDIINMMLDEGNIPVQEKSNAIAKILNSYDIFQRKIEKIRMYSLLCSDFPTVRDEDAPVYRCDELKNDVWFSELLNSNYKSMFFVNNLNGESYITFSKLIADTDTRKPVAIVSMDINISTLYSHINNVKLFENDMMFIATNTTILNVGNDNRFNTFLNNNELFNNMIKNGIDCSQTVISGKEYLINCFPIQDTGLYLVNAVDTSEFNILNESMLLAILITSMPFIAFLFVMLLFISYTVIKPITGLSKQMHEYNNEFTMLSLPKKTYNDEINTLYTSFNEMVLTIKNLMEDIKKQAQIQRETEFRVLQAQIKPHFLYNTLNSVSAMAADIKAHKIQSMITNLAQFFRYSLNSGMEFIPVENELKQVVAYANIQQFRKNDKFSLSVDMDESIAKLPICKLILQPLVENSIEHGFEYLSKGGIIKIECFAEDNDIILKVSDNGAGLNFMSINDLNALANSEPQDLTSSFGIYNTNKRIKLYYGENYGLSYSENDMNGITATIKLPQTPSDK